MVYSYINAPDDIPKRAKQFIKAAAQGESPSGMIMAHDAFEKFLEQTQMLPDITRLSQAVTDEESRKRVDAEIKRLVVTARVPKDLAAEIEEVVEVLGLHRTELTIAEVPLVATLYLDNSEEKEYTVLSITGKKSLADAVRNLYARVLTSEYIDNQYKTAIVVHRMPPCIATARANLVDGQWVVQAAHGWGHVAAPAEEGDIFIINSNATQIQSKNVQPQNNMIVRNPRSQDMTKVKDPDQTGQKITDQQALAVVRAARKADIGGVVVGLGEQEKSWMLRVLPNPEGPQDIPAKTEEVVLADAPPVAVQEEPEPTVEPMSSPEQPPDQEPEESSDEKRWDEEEQIEEGIKEVEQEIQEVTSQATPPRPSQAAKKEALRSAERTLSHALSAITYALKEHLHVQEAVALPDLLNQVEQEKEVPNKQRLLSLWEMYQRGDFQNPSPDLIQFALETMNKFFEEFS